MSTHYDSYADLRSPDRCTDITPRPAWDLGQGDRLPPPRPSQPRGNRRLVWVGGAGALVVLLGCSVAWYFGSTAVVPEEKKDEPPAPKRTMLKDNLFLEIQGDRRRVIVVSTVVLREGQLEGLLCRERTKQHEYILATPVDARDIHTALLAANGKPGTPVQFQPKYVPASGSVIKVTLQYQKDGKLMTARGQDWIRDVKAGKSMETDWVFAGSRFVPNTDEPNKPPIYLANQGDYICVCNMESAMLDLPVRSPKTLDMRVYDAFTERIPPKETRVEIILEVVPEKK
jgi:hypothetical protein